MSKILLVLFLHIVTASPQDGHITCTIPPVEMFKDAVLTCNFPEDLNVTKKDFAIYYYLNNNRDDIVDCWWLKGEMTCSAKPDIVYQTSVNRSFTVTLLNVSTHTGEYACQMANYDPKLIQNCHLQIKSEETVEEENNSTLVIVLISTMLSVAGVAAGSVILFLTIRRKLRGRRMRTDGEDHPMINKKKRDLVTEMLQDFLLTKTKEMYPNMSEKCYFVPPVYLNKLRYKTQSVAGQVVYIPDPPDPSDDRRDRAVQQVLHSLHHMADTQQEHMFVLTQFKYEDYLNNPGHDYRKHRLPVPADLIKKQKYNDLGSFDFLIIHRHFGVLVGVVKAADEKESGNQDRKQRIEDNRGQSSQMIRKETNSCETKGKTDGKGSLHKKQKTEDSGSRDSDQETVQNASKYNDKSKDCERKPEDYEILDDKTNPKDTRRDDTVKMRYHKQGRENRRSTEEIVITEVSEAIKQFRNADRMIKHLLSDQQQSPLVRLTLVLPKVTSNMLLSALISHPQLTQNFLEGIQQQCINDFIKLCLCADHLPNPDTTRNVESITNHFKMYWDQLWDCSVDKLAMTDDLYQNMIARFCGPSSISYFETPCQPKAIKYQLPKTLDQAVSLTGDLFERLTLYPGMIDLLDEPRVFLVGPPGTGKTRMLSLVGNKWLSEGHDVFVLYTRREDAAASMELQTLLQQTSTTQSQAIPAPTVITLLCNIDNDNKIHNSIKILKDRVKEKPLFALVDEIAPEKEKAKQVHVFLTKIIESLKDPHLWATSYCAEILPPGWKGKFLKEPITCPPSIVRETGQEQCSLGLTNFSKSKCFSPADGLPVKHICHQDLNHSKNEPRDCGVCGEEVATFLTQDLHVADTVSDIFPMASNTTLDQGTWMRPVKLQYRDVLILFERDITEDVPMITSLKEKGIPVQIISSRDEKTALRPDTNTVLVAKAGLLNGLKRKVVVYVEGNINRSEFSSQWNRLRGITSCTSQLVYIRSSY